MLDLDQTQNKQEARDTRVDPMTGETETGLRSWPLFRWTGSLRPLDHLWIAILAAVGRVLHLIIAIGSELFHGLFLDAQLYAETARAIRSTGEASPGPYLLSPLYPYFLALFPSMDGPAISNPAYGVRGLQCLFGVATCVLVGRIAGNVSGRLAGLLAGAVAAMFGPLIHADSMVMLAGPLAFCITAGLAAAVEAECRDERRWWLASGIALGIAAALRPTALVIGASIGIVLLMRFLRGDRAESGDSARRLPAFLALLLFLVGISGPILPFALHNRRVGAESVLLSAGGGFNFWIGNHEGSLGVFNPPRGYSLALDPIGVDLARRESGRGTMTISESSEWWRDKALEFISSQPSDWINQLGRKLALFLHPQEIPQLGSGFAWHRDRSWALVTSIDARWLLLLGIFAPFARNGFRRARRGPRRALGHVYVALIAYTLITCVFFVSGRHRLPIMPCVIALSAITIVEWVHSESIRRLWILSFLFVLGAFSATQYRSGGRFAIELNASVEERHRGVRLMEEGRIEEAIEIFMTSLRENESASTRLNLARALRAKGASDQALLEYQRVLIANPRHAIAKFDLGVLLWEDRGDVVNATRCFRDAVEISPSFHEGWFNLGSLLIAGGEFAEAYEVLERALVGSSTSVAWRDQAERAVLHCVERLRAADGQ
ncbi:MAG: 4-amino-4-deoxy-L-arabinose transferase-like glycosyltransferase [Planctomycetota bacterium]